jgi:hypothetical protein
MTIATLTDSKTESAMDIRLTKDDVVDMFVQERQAEFTAKAQVIQDKIAAKNLEKQAITSESLVEVARLLREKHKDFLKVVEPLLGRTFTFQGQTENCDGINLCFSGQLLSNDPSLRMRRDVRITLDGQIDFDSTPFVTRVKKLMQELFDLQNELNQVNNESAKLNQLSQRAKASIVRSIMNSTENGRSLLKAITAATDK